MGVGCDRLQRGFSVSRTWFILLAGGTSSDVVFCEALHVFSLVRLAEEVYSVGYAWVACEGMVMIHL